MAGEKEDVDIGDHGEKAGMFMYDGIRFFPLPEHMLKGEKQIDKLKKLKNAKFQDDDMIIFAYPKTGTHWTWEVLEMLKRENLEHRKQVKEYKMLEFIFSEGIDACPKPRILNTHLPLRMLSSDIKEKKIKCIHIMRNPKDTCVSLYNHAKNANSKVPMDLSFSNFIKVFLSGKAVFGAYYDYLKTFREESKDLAKDQVIDLYYETMKEDPVGSVKRLAKFLELSVSDKFCEDVAEACSFKKLQKAEKEVKDDGPFQLWREGSGGTFYRKGEVGDWKNWFTVAESEIFDKIWNENMKGSDLVFKYTL